MPGWQLLAQLDRLHEMQAQWYARLPDRHQLRMSFDEMDEIDMSPAQSRAATVGSLMSRGTALRGR